jgi:hypothetical protein
LKIRTEPLTSAAPGGTRSPNRTEPALEAAAGGIVSHNFFSSGLRQDVDRLMDLLWSGGVNNPMDAIEQVSYLVFLRLLSDGDESMTVLDPTYTPIFSGDWEQYAWGSLVTLTGDDLFEATRDAIEKLHALPGMSETGRALFRQATLKIYDRPTLRAVTQKIDAMDLDGGGQDLKGDMYEYLLSKLSVAGTNGQFRTPRHIIAMIVALLDPQPGERICDPATGTAGFHVASFRHILQQHSSAAALAEGNATGDLLTPAQWDFMQEQAFTGFDNDANMVKLAILNLYLHRLERARILFHNPLTANLAGGYWGETFDVILANPPFAARITRGEAVRQVVHRPPCAGRPGRRDRAERRAVRRQPSGEAGTRAAADRMRPAGGGEPTERRVQAVFRRGDGRAGVQEGRADGARLVLRAHRRRLQPGRQAPARGAQRHRRRAGEVAGARGGAALLLGRRGSHSRERPQPDGGPVPRCRARRCGA